MAKAISLPDEIIRQAETLATQEKISVEELVAASISFRWANATNSVWEEGGTISSQSGG